MPKEIPLLGRRRNFLGETMIRWLLFTPAFSAAALLMLPSKTVRADDAAPATQPAGGAVTVTVNDADGKPVSGAHVTITPPRGKKAAAAAQAKKPKAGGGAGAGGGGRAV